MSEPVIIHRYGVFRPDGTAVSASARVHIGSPVLHTPRQVGWGGHDLDGVWVDLLHVPMDDRPDDWARLWAEWHIYGDQETHHLAHGRPRGLVHTGWAAHPEEAHAHVRLGGTLQWGHDPHPRIVEHAALMRGLTEAEALALHCGPPHVPVTPAYHPEVRTRPRTARLDLRYDGSVAIALDADLIGRDGAPLGHGHTHIHRLTPNAWHGLTAHALLAGAHGTQHARLGLDAPHVDALAMILHPRGTPSDGTRGRAPRAAPPVAANLAPDHRIQPHTLTLHSDYNGDMAIEIRGALVTANGQATGHTHTYEVPFSPTEWSTTPLPVLVEQAIAAHHAELGLAHPAHDADTCHVHPHLHHTRADGYPGATLWHPVPPAPTTPAVDHDALRRHIVARKEAELGVDLGAHLHPALGDYVPTPLSNSTTDSRAAEYARRDAYIAAHSVWQGE